MLKFFSWAFSITKRHRREINFYQKGLKGRIFTIVFSLILVGACVGIQYWLLSFLSSFGSTDRPLLALIGIIILLAVMLMTTFDYIGTFCYVAFKNAFFGIIESTAMFIEKRANEKKFGNQTNQEATVDDPANSPANIKTYKALDICIGILEGLLIIGTVASVFLVAFVFAK